MRREGRVEGSNRGKRNGERDNAILTCSGAAGLYTHRRRGVDPPTEVFLIPRKVADKAQKSSKQNKTTQNKTNVALDLDD